MAAGEGEPRQEEINKEQAIGLFRNLEENLKAYGRKPRFEDNQDESKKDW